MCNVHLQLFFYVYMAMGARGGIIPTLIGGSGVKHKYFQTPLILFLSAKHFQRTPKDMGPPPFILIDGMSLVFSKFRVVLRFEV